MKRYDPEEVYIGTGEYVGGMTEFSDGEYVLYADHVAELAAVRADAERYRWLRERINWRDVEEYPRFAVFRGKWREWFHVDFRESPPESEHIDDYIDAARKEAP